jgi:CubicO group peptidase (beta-lactamase class C family)
VNLKKLFFPSLLVCTLLTLGLRLFSRSASAKPAASNSSYDQIDAYVKDQMQRLNMPGVSLAIIDGDRIVHQRGFGQARPNGEAPTPQTPFFIGSLTKSFTSLSVMQLVEAGKVELDAPVQRYLPWFRVADPQASAQITVRHLMNQTSSLSITAGDIPLSDFDPSPGATERQARALATLKLTRPVGSAFEYSNANYNLLGLVIEAASGETYADYIQKHILSPLDMSHTYTSPALAKQNGLAMGHRYWFSLPFAAPNMPVPYGSLPAGMLISTSEDLSHYLIAFMNGGRYGQAQIISPAGITELQRGAADFGAMGLDLGQYAMGWFVSDLGQSKLIWHSGTLPDFSAYMAILPGQKKGLVLLFNADHHWMNPVLTEFGSGAAALLAGEKPNPIPMVGLIPWMLRALLLVPLLQIVEVSATLRQLRRWRLNPELRAGAGHKWGLHILLPLIQNLLIALTLIPILGESRGYLMLYMPDYSWVAMLCGSFSLLWSFIRTRLVLDALKDTPATRPAVTKLAPGHTA